MKNIRVFYLKIFRILEVKFSIYLNRRVFVMIFYIFWFMVLFMSISGILRIYVRITDEAKLVETSYFVPDDLTFQVVPFFRMRRLI